MPRRPRFRFEVGLERDRCKLLQISGRSGGSETVDRRSVLSWTTIVEHSEYVLEPLRKDEEFVLYRRWQSDQPSSPSVLQLAPASARPAQETLRKIEHEYSLRDQLDSAWAVGPLALSDQPGQLTLVLEDPGGETLGRWRWGGSCAPLSVSQPHSADCTRRG